VREEQKALPWPFARPARPPLSPPLSLPSQYSRSLSVDSSPSRGPPRPCPGPGAYRSQTPHSQYLENVTCRAKRTSQQGLAARSSLYSRHLSSKDLGLLLERQPSSFQMPGVKPEQREREADTRGQTDPVGHTDTHRPPPSSQPLVSTSPPPSVSRQGPDCGQTSLTLGRGTEADGSSEQGMGAEMERDGGMVRESGRGGAWSWTVDEPRCTAQWVRRKQEYRSTRPW
ncbi:hypothetical protein JZ751_012895, partial [Albula glossodonta]